MSKKTTESYRFDFIDFSKHDTKLLEDKRVVKNQVLYNIVMGRLKEAISKAWKEQKW